MTDLTRIADHLFTIATSLERIASALERAHGPARLTNADGSPWVSPWGEDGESRQPPAPYHTDLMVSPESLDAFLEANPPPDDDGWIEWNGGVCPVEPETRVDVIIRDGRKMTSPASQFSWPHRKLINWDIISYRPHKESQ